MLACHTSMAATGTHLPVYVTFTIGGVNTNSASRSATVATGRVCSGTLNVRTSLSPVLGAVAFCGEEDWEGGGASVRGATRVDASSGLVTSSACIHAHKVHGASKYLWEVPSKGLCSGNEWLVKVTV